MAAGFKRICGGEQRWVVRRGAEQRRGSSSSAQRWAEQPGLVSHGGARAKARQEKHGASPTKGSAGLDAGERRASRGCSTLVR